ncbi:hypothetical protein WHI96_13895 [Pseudonocardia tropica]|uniref:Uncharacterized protein n=1 Tax=Pseudonocardia tropica TaxID=681289 RepID=A0ABV1JVE1_9PSEU
MHANNTHFTGGDLTDDGVRERLHDLADAVVAFARAVPRGAAGPAAPDIPRRSLREG